jgi:predicted RNA-binding protein YlqC (UPF0109 family)
MSDHEEISQWFLSTVRLIVDHPGDVSIDAIPGVRRTTFRIKVNKRDVGKVIGGQARTVQSLRVLAGVSGLPIATSIGQLWREAVRRRIYDHGSAHPGN